jgi:hypothetical protein
MKMMRLLSVFLWTTVVAAEAAAATLTHRLFQQEAQPIAISPLPRIAKLRLIDADTDQPVPGFDPLPTKTVVDLTTLNGVSNLNVEVITESGSAAVASIQWQLNGAPARVDGSAPWSFCGNKAMDFFACDKLKAGLTNATIFATPYSASGATGLMGETISIQLSIIKSTPTSLSFTLVNADSDTDIAPFVNDTVIDLTTTPRVNVRANVDTLIGSVQFMLNNQIVRVENGAPYALWANSGNDYFAWTPPVGSHVMTATVYSERNAQGDIGAVSSVAFVVKEGTASKAPTMAPIASTNTSDTTAPLLLNFTTTSQTSIINVSNVDEAPVWEFTIQALDADSGLVSVCIVATYNINQTISECPKFSPGFPLQTLYTYSAGFYPTSSAWRGVYTVSIELKDDAGNKASISSNDLKARGFPSSFTVVGAASNAPTAPANTAPTRAPVAVAPAPVPFPVFAPTNVVDTIKPRLLQLNLLTPTVDVSNGPATAILQLTAQDENSGILRCLLGASAQFYSTSRDYYPTTNSAGTAISFNMTLDFDPYIRPGPYKLDIMLRDVAYNVIFLNEPDLAALNFPTAIQVVNTNVDLVIAMNATTPTKIDVSTAPATVTFVIQLEDVGFGIDSVSLTAIGKERRVNAYESVFPDPPAVGRRTFVLDLVFPAFAKPEVYALELKVEDDGWNRQTYNASALASLGLVSTIEVVSSNADVTAPRLLNLTAVSPLVVNYSAAYPNVNFDMSALDDKSGIWAFCLVASYDTNQSASECPGPLPFPITDVLGHTADFIFNPEAWGYDPTFWREKPLTYRGLYTLSVYLRDDEENEVTISSEELIARGFPGSFTVV